MPEGIKDGQMVSSGVDPAVLMRVARGEYIIDEKAVAEAMVRRVTDHWRMPPVSRMFVPAELTDGGTVRPQQD